MNAILISGLKYTANACVFENGFLMHGPSTMLARFKSALIFLVSTIAITLLVSLLVTLAEVL